ncbi:MAG: hypothetical protein R2873_22945 [Caldilineaceae bacterium]|nr:hypothetical protein [Caldilineaceae bacterium]
MFQNSTLASVVELPQNLPHTQVLRTARRALRAFPYPQTARDYLIWLAGMAVLAAMVSMQILLSMQIQQTSQVLDGLTAEFVAVEQENAELLWQISQFTHLERIETEAVRMGYGPGLNPEYRWVDTATESPPIALLQTAETVGNAAGDSAINLSDSDPIGGWFERSWQRLQTLWHTESGEIGAMLGAWTGERF